MKTIQSYPYKPERYGELKAEDSKGIGHYLAVHSTKELIRKALISMQDFKNSLRGEK